MTRYMNNSQALLPRRALFDCERQLERAKGAGKYDMTDILNRYLRSKLSSRSAVIYEANRRGLVTGICSRVGKPIGRAEARRKAVETAEGRDPVRSCEVPERWRALFVRVFVKAAVHAAHTDHNIKVRG